MAAWKAFNHDYSPGVNPSMLNLNRSLIIARPMQTLRVSAKIFSSIKQAGIILGASRLTSPVRTRRVDLLQKPHASPIPMAASLAERTA